MLSNVQTPHTMIVAVPIVPDVQTTDIRDVVFFVFFLSCSGVLVELRPCLRRGSMVMLSFP